MKKQIKKFSVHQTSKALALVYFVFMVVFGVPWAIYLAFAGLGEDAAAVMVVLLIYFFVFYIAAVLWTWVYNLVASTFGGIEFTLSDE